ncbi:MAG: hypothetical protein C0594_00460, partial [Marinilabiliales bacterium]
MRIKLLVLFFVIFHSLNAQEIDWINTSQDGGSSYIKDFCLDYNKTSYLLYDFTGTISVFDTVLTSGSSSSLIVKTDSLGELLCAFEFGNPTVDLSLAV